MGPRGAQSSPTCPPRRSRRTGGGTILCFHHAGGGVLSAARLASALPAGCGVAALALPGPRGPREWRGNLPPGGDCGRIAQEFAAIFGDGRTRLVMLGNGFGALLAPEVTRQIDRTQPCSSPPPTGASIRDTRGRGSHKLAGGRHSAWQEASAHPIDPLSLDTGHFPWATAADEVGTLLAKALKAERTSGARYIALESIKPVSDDPD